MGGKLLFHELTDLYLYMYASTFSVTAYRVHHFVVAVPADPIRHGSVCSSVYIYNVYFE